MLVGFSSWFIDTHFAHHNQLVGVISSSTADCTMDLDDDDSENDSDYDPGADDTKSVEEESSDQVLVGLSRASKRKVDALWLEMVEEDRRSTEAIMMKSINYLANRAPKLESVRIANELILSNIFGKKIGKRLASYQATPEDEYDAQDIKKRALESVQKVQKRQKVTETRRFAGQEILVQRTVLQSSADAQAAEISKKKGPGGGLDSVLSTIKGPKLVSTVAKSSMDWDVYKEKEGLEEDLQAAAKDGYLTRKDFLERCDVRTYEVEKVDRITTKAGGVAGSAHP